MKINWRDPFGKKRIRILESENHILKSENRVLCDMLGQQTNYKEGYDQGRFDVAVEILKFIAIRKSSVAYEKSKDYKLACDTIEDYVLDLKDWRAARNEN